MLHTAYRLRARCRNLVEQRCPFALFWGSGSFLFKQIANPKRGTQVVVWLIWLVGYKGNTCLDVLLSAGAVVFGVSIFLVVNIFEETVLKRLLLPGKAHRTHRAVLFLSVCLLLAAVAWCCMPPIRPQRPVKTVHVPAEVQHNFNFPDPTPVGRCEGSKVKMSL